ncbi:hypothetical protein [Bradyrhizobium neotropicale]|uniref:hypothetical protein n=1 Tax=Bradyrhizobium neotropicale TaxID=1497615 RepID=UPI001AD7D704|nr:hypothetical protein [Bradyrhizobium neotropicale]MBO4227836.1 hypothetical protein [Bradyrhizobium neotropicale]
MIKAARVKGVRIYPVAPASTKVFRATGHYRARDGLRPRWKPLQIERAVSFWLKRSVSFVRGNCHTACPYSGTSKISDNW